MWNKENGEAAKTTFDSLEMARCFGGASPVSWRMRHTCSASSSLASRQQGQQGCVCCNGLLKTCPLCEMSGSRRAPAQVRRCLYQRHLIMHGTIFFGLLAAKVLLSPYKTFQKIHFCIVITMTLASFLCEYCLFLLNTPSVTLQLKY